MYSASYGFFDGAEHNDILEVRCKTEDEAYEVAYQLKEAHFNDYEWANLLASNPNEEFYLSRSYSWVEVRKDGGTIENITVNLY